MRPAGSCAHPTLGLTEADLCAAAAGRNAASARMEGISERSEPDSVPNGDCRRTGTRIAGVEIAQVPAPVPRLALGAYVWMAAAGDSAPSGATCGIRLAPSSAPGVCAPHRPAAIRHGDCRMLLVHQPEEPARPGSYCWEGLRPGAPPALLVSEGRPPGPPDCWTSRRLPPSQLKSP